MFTTLDTVLRFTLEPEPACDGAPRTRRRLEHQGFSGLKLVLASFVMGFGWNRRVLPRIVPVLDELARQDAARAK